MLAADCSRKGNGSGKNVSFWRRKNTDIRQPPQDLSNSDTEAHENKPDLISAKVRNWLNSQSQLRAPGPGRGMGAIFNQFMAANYYDLTTSRGFSSADAA